MQRHFQLALNPNERFMLFTRLVFETRDTENKKIRKEKSKRKPRAIISTLGFFESEIQLSY